MRDLMHFFFFQKRSSISWLISKTHKSIQYQELPRVSETIDGIRQEKTELSLRLYLE
jgi:hypothetical protein